MLNEQNKKAFLRNVSLALGRNAVPDQVDPFDFSKGPQNFMMNELSQEELLEVFLKECDRLGTKYKMANAENLKDVLLEVIADYGGGKVLYPETEEMERYGIYEAFEKAAQENDSTTYVMWDAEKGRQANIDLAQDANIGVTFPIAGIAETATILQQCSRGSGRSIGLLPLTHIAVVRKDTIYPRMTQTMALLRQKFKEDRKAFPSNLVHISGPSNTADIELVRVVGVHGPINVTYIVLED